MQTQSAYKSASKTWSKPVLRAACPCWLPIVTVLVAAAGCGGPMTQSDLLKHGISRPDADGDQATPPQVVAAAAKSSYARPAIVNEDPTGADRPEPIGSVSPTDRGMNAQSPESNREAVDSVRTSSLAISSIQPIDARAPSQPLEQRERRTMAANNLERVTVAINQWVAGSKRLPTNVIRNSQNRPTLSWRVKILPLLGYDDLYQQFDQSKTWDHPANKRLLKFIPPEFVSPERFDTNTNLQLMVNGPALFSEKKPKFKSEISDAPLILMMAEVDDQMAVPWTSPFDYDVTEDPLDRGLGNLRADGFFFSWMSGQVSIWPNPINRVHLRKAVTFEAGDTFPREKYQVYPSLNLDAESRPQLASGRIGDTTSSSVTANVSSSTPLPVNPGTGHVQSLRTASPLPSSEEILIAEGKVRQTYEDMFNQARSPVELARLAKVILKHITSGNLPDAETYVGLRTAMKIAVRGQDPRSAMAILDELASRFAVDRYDLEESIVKGFLGSRGSLRTQLSKASELLPTVERLIVHDISSDDFGAAKMKMTNAQAALRTVSDAKTHYRWKVLKERVEEGKRLFPRISKHMETLASNPGDPAANAAVGWYFCVVKKNWTEGLRLLALTEEPTLRVLAQLEMQEDDNTTRYVRLGDGWWTFAEQNRADELVFEAAMQRSRRWYMQAAANLSDGLDRIRANDRIVRINRRIGELPDLAGQPYDDL